MDASPVVDDIFLRQPFQRRVGRDRKGLRLAGARAGAAVEFASRRGSQERAGAGVQGNVDAQVVAADHAARRVEDGDMAEVIPLGIKRPLHLQRAAMRVLPQDRAGELALKTEGQLGLPAGRWRGNRS